MARKAAEVTLSEQERQELERVARSQNTAAVLVERAKIVLMAALYMTNRSIADALHIDRQRVRRWRSRWVCAKRDLDACAAENITDSDLERRVREVLSDRYRSGTPATFQAEQIAQLISLACEKPEAAGLPLSHWSADDLACEAIHRGIVKTISGRHVDRLLKQIALRPHRSQYWLNSPDKKNFAEYEAAVENVCDIYRRAPKLFEDGVHVICTDEKTGIQILERKHPAKPTRPGWVERVEFEYIRHGTQCLIANFEVATGKIVMPTIGDTRTEENFVDHIRATVASDPSASWIFVVDQLNTHKSAALVELVAELCEISEDLGKKRICGTLKTMKSRKKFLEDESHRIRFVYTPRHCSWLNQIEIWFSILARRLLRRSSFEGIDHLHERIAAFISYFNIVRAKPFKWTYTGKLLKV